MIIIYRLNHPSEVLSSRNKGKKRTEMEYENSEK